MILAITQAKGGTGKSTIAVHVAAALLEQGDSVTLVDADANRSAARWAAEACPDLAVERVDTADELLEGLPEVARRSTWTVVDCAGGSDELTRAALLRADLALLPCGPGALDLRALALTARLVSQAVSIREGLPEATIILNRVRKGTKLAAEARELASSTGLEVMHTVLHERTGLADAVGQGKLAWDYPPAAESALELRAMIAELRTSWSFGDNEEWSPEGFEEEGQ